MSGWLRRMFDRLASPAATHRPPLSTTAPELERTAPEHHRTLRRAERIERIISRYGEDEARLRLVLVRKR